jgi:hypothetical protein
MEERPLKQRKKQDTELEEWLETKSPMDQEKFRRVISENEERKRHAKREEEIDEWLTNFDVALKNLLERNNGRVYIFSAAHGSAPSEGTFFTMPADVTLKLLKFSTPGNLCFTAETSSIQVLAIVNDIQAETASKPIDDVETDLRRLGESYQTQFLCKVSEDQPGRYATASDIRRYKSCVAAEGYYRIITVNPGDPMLNYKYNFDEEDQSVSANLHILGLPQFDMGKLCHARSRRGEYFTYNSLSNIVFFLRNHGVKEIVMVDLSCSRFDDAAYQTHDGWWRELRTDIMSKTTDEGKKVKYGGFGFVKRNTKNKNSKMIRYSKTMKKTETMKKTKKLKKSKMSKKSKNRKL